LEAEALGAFPSTLDPIEVFDFRGQVFSLDNRRLAIARAADVPVPIVVRIPETAVDNSKFTTEVAGLFIELN